MAHFAQLDSNNHVVQVIVLDNNDILDENGDDSEALGLAFCRNHIGDNSSVWKQTHYSAVEGKGTRGNYAGVGCTFLTNVETLGVGSTDIYIGINTNPSWTVGLQTAKYYPPNNPGWQPNMTYQESTEFSYSWNESNYNNDPSTAWVKVMI